MEYPTTLDTETSPEGSMRLAVRGFFASMSLSRMRLRHMPTVRALIRAVVTKNQTQREGGSSATSSTPMYARGSAKTDSFTLINLSNTIVLPFRSYQVYYVLAHDYFIRPGSVRFPLYLYGCINPQLGTVKGVRG